MKKALSLSIAIALCLLLCACGVVTPPNASTQGSPSPSSPTVIIPDKTEPTTPSTAKPTVPNTTAPTVPETTEPTVPNTTAPTVPETTEPTVPNTTAPTVPETTAPTAPTAPAECSHYYQIKESIASTCTQTGLTVYACSNCGHSYQVEMPLASHIYAAATCTKPLTCTVCGATSGSALGHDYQIRENVAATCTATGHIQYTCSRCADTYTDTIAKIPHSYADATCTEPQTCTVCGTSKGNPLDHNYVDNVCTRCGQISSNFTIPAGGYDGSDVTITFYHTMGSQLRSILDAYIADFNKLYPNIHIEHQQVGGWSDIEELITLDLAAGTGPNIAYCYPDHVASYNQFGSVVTLDGLIGSTIQYTNAQGGTEILGLTPAQISDFIPGFYEEGRQLGDGLMYSLPLSKSSEVMYYNKTFFEEHNLAVPTTWDELEALCAQIKQIDPTCIPFAYDNESNWFINLCAQYGSDYTSATGEHYLFNNDLNQQLILRLRDWYQKGYITTQNNYGAYTSNLFTSTSGTRCYMSIGSSGGARHYLPTYDYNTGTYPFEVGVARIPQANPDSSKVISQGPSLCLFQSANSQEVIASWLFMKYLTTNVAFQAEFSMASGYMPVIQSVTDNEIYAHFLSRADGFSNIAARVIQVCLSQRDAYFTSPVFVGSSQARSIVGELLVYALNASDNGDPASLISALFDHAVKRCIDPTTPPFTGPETPPADPEMPTSDKIVIRHLADDLYITGTEYLYTSSTGKTKTELELSSNRSDAQVFTLVTNSDGTISFRKDDGSYLYCDANSVGFVTQQSDYTKFVLEEAEGGWFIRCAVANYNGRPQYLEVYSGYLTCYSMGSNESHYIFLLENAE